MEVRKAGSNEGLRWGWGGHSPVGAGQSGRGEEGAAGAALAAVKTGARTSPGAGDRSGWDSAAATALERLPGIAIGLLVGPPCNRTLLCKDCNRKRNYEPPMGTYLGDTNPQ